LGPADSYTTMSNELTLQEAALAWAQGKRVEAIGPSNAWGLIQEVGSSDGMWQPGVFSGDSSRVFRFRLAPEPPAKKWRPWTLEEVPIGALIRWKSDSNKGVRSLIVSAHETPGGAVWICGGQKTIWNAEEAVKLEYSIDNGKTWLPCGVEVEA